jgi:hypothetical protein
LFELVSSFGRVIEQEFVLRGNIIGFEDVLAQLYSNRLILVSGVFIVSRILGFFDDFIRV